MNAPRRDGPGLAPVQHSVLAVVVAYERGLGDIACWPALCTEMGTAPENDAFRIAHVLIYDNSPRCRFDSAALPSWASLVHDPENGGTAAAYRCALDRAQTKRLSWLLLLDHDTSMSTDLLPLASVAVRDHPVAAPPGAILPLVRQGSGAVSPACITILGTVQPLTCPEARTTACKVSGIASGALVNVQAIRAVGPPPDTLWLDYVDHWLFDRIQAHGFHICISRAVLEHDLSVNQPHKLSSRRLLSILNGESIFVESLAWPGRFMHPLRLLWRAMRPSSISLQHRVIILRHLAKMTI